MEGQPHEVYPNYGKFFIGNFSRGHVWQSTSKGNECKTNGCLCLVTRVLPYPKLNCGRALTFVF